jgi:uncharacterized protein
VQLVQVEYTKYNGVPHRLYQALRLGSDEHGTWLGVPRSLTTALPGYKYTDPYVLLVPHDDWWTAMFNAPPRRTEVYCDVATPARWSQDAVEVVDLDLDVRRRRDGGQVELLDEEEFATHARLLGYPHSLAQRARSAASWLLGALADGTEPFAGGYRGWLAQVA